MFSTTRLLNATDGFCSTFFFKCWEFIAGGGQRARKKVLEALSVLELSNVTYLVYQDSYMQLLWHTLKVGLEVDSGIAIEALFGNYNRPGRLKIGVLALGMPYIQVLRVCLSDNGPD